MSETVQKRNTSCGFRYRSSLIVWAAFYFIGCRPTEVCFASQFYIGLHLTRFIRTIARLDPARRFGYSLLLSGRYAALQGLVEKFTSTQQAPHIFQCACMCVYLCFRFFLSVIRPNWNNRYKARWIVFARWCLAGVRKKLVSNCRICFLPRNNLIKQDQLMRSREFGQETHRN